MPRRGVGWLDTGTHASLVEASYFMQILEERQGMLISCPEKIALFLGYITLDRFHGLASNAERGMTTRRKVNAP
jgi:glucose-1-phosphate thymidylyltransferase